MKTTFQSRPNDQTRRMIRLSEFSFEAYPVLISENFRCAPHPASAPKRWQPETVIKSIFAKLFSLTRNSNQSQTTMERPSTQFTNATSEIPCHKNGIAALGPQKHLCQRFATVAALASALVLTGCEKPAASKTPEKSLVRATAAEPAGDVRSDGQAAYLASVKFDHETDLNFKVGGIVVRVGPNDNTDWDEGTPVKAGTVLAELKQSDFQNALDTAGAKAELTSKTLERFQKLRATDAISQQELDVVEAEWRTAWAALDQAEQNLKDSRLVADKNGVILARYINRGVTVPPGQRVLRFADTSLMSVELGLPDRLIGKVTPGQEIDVEISALEGMPPFKGRVSEVGVAASGEGRLFRVVIKVPNPDGLLRSGMTARIHIGDAAPVPTGTVCIPLSALVTLVADGAQPGAQTQLSVFVVQDGKAVKRAVKTGDILKSSILVTEGLRAGEQVVTSGASLLYDGAPIEVAPELVQK